VRKDRVPAGPQSWSFAMEGQDNPLAGIVISWTEWGPMWRWTVMYWTPSGGYENVIVECGELTVRKGEL
jgi:hypothetical protein